MNVEYSTHWLTDAVSSRLGLTLRFTTWANLCSWSSFTVSAVSRCISWQSFNLCKFLYYTHSTCCYLFSSPCRLYIYCISSSDKANLSLCYHWSWLRSFAVLVPYSDSSSVSVSSAAASLPQASRWYLNTSRVVIVWQMSHLANRPENSSSDKPGFLMRPILSIFFHFVSLGIIIELGSVRSNNVCQF